MAMSRFQSKFCCWLSIFSKPSCLLILLISTIFIIFNFKIRFLQNSSKSRQPLIFALQPLTYVPANSIPEQSERHCQPKNNAVFLKTHKAASSTVQNIFMRYGDARNLSFVLPKSGHILDHPNPFHFKLTPEQLKGNLTYNLLVHHSRFNYNGMQSLMPRDTVYVTILRDPVDLFESLYYYCSLFDFYNLTLEAVAQLPLTSTIFQRRYIDNMVGINQMMFDLGLNGTSFFNATSVNRYIDFLDSVFELVMIVERMDESLVLLRDLMCWNDDDVVAFKINARNAHFKTELSPSVRTKLRQINMADQMLYDHFAAKFEKKVREYGEDRMASDLMSLRCRREDWYSACVEKPVGLNERKPKHPQLFDLKIMSVMPKNNINSTCEALTSIEVEFTDRLKEKQPFYLLS